MDGMDASLIPSLQSIHAMHHSHQHMMGPPNNGLLQPLQPQQYSVQQSHDSDSDNDHDHFDDDQQDKKPRIPWDRNPRGDRNGLKYSLLSCINENEFHVKGKYLDNFKAISHILSSESSPFLKYRGIEPSGAQRKFNSVLRDVAKTFKVANGYGEIVDESDALPFESLALKMLRDIIEKEKSKKVVRRHNKVDGNDDNMMDEFGDELTSILRKRKSDVVELKNAMRKVAASQMVDEVSMVDSMVDTQMAPPAKIPRIHRLDIDRHNFVVDELRKFEPPILSVEHLFAKVGVSEASASSFMNKTGIRLDRPVDRMLKLYEEVAAAPDFATKMRDLCGILPGDSLELEYLLKPLYMSTN